MSSIMSKATLTLGAVPDIHSRTRVLGVVGVPRDKANPRLDGWFVSDFFLMYRLLVGETISQTWLTCAKPGDLVDDYEFFAHGNPYLPQKIVLDRSTIVRMAGSEGGGAVVAILTTIPSDITVEEESKIHEKTLEYLDKICSEASIADDPVLFLVFSHGNFETAAIAVGQKGGYLTGLHKSHVTKVVSRYSGINFTMMATSCFSGPWPQVFTVEEDNVRAVTGTVLTAAGFGPSAYSESWVQSNTAKRFYGGILVSAVADILCADDVAEGISDARDDMKTFREFTSDIALRAKHISVEKTHQFQFSAQNDEWDMEYHRRTGIPAARFQEKLNALLTRDANIDKTGYANPAPDDFWKELGIPERPGDMRPGSQEYLLMMSRTGASPDFLKQSITIQTSEYMSSKPGSSTAANNKCHGLFRRILEHDKITDGEWNTAASILQYRLGISLRAKKILNHPAMEMAVPEIGLAVFDVHNHKDYRDIDPLVRMMLELEVIPRPEDPADGEPWYKPHIFIAYSLCEAQVPMAEARKRLEAVKRDLEQGAKAHARRLTKGLGGETRGREGWAGTFRRSMRRLRELSPIKKSQRSKRSSIGPDTFEPLY